jgi:hypothetical protein
MTTEAVVQSQACWNDISSQSLRVSASHAGGTAPDRSNRGVDMMSPGDFDNDDFDDLAIGVSVIRDVLGACAW